MSADHDAHLAACDHAAARQAEQARWQAALGAGDCCTYGCIQGRNCPARAARQASPAADSEDISDDTGYLICRGLALTVVAVSVVMYLLL